jgi:hypothetical protein
MTYHPEKIMMNEYNGDAIYAELTEKINSGDEIRDADMLNLIFLPLMRTTVPRDELAVKSAEMARRISDAAKRNACIAAAFAFGSRYLDKDKVDKLLEVLKMSDLAMMLIDRKMVEVAKKMLRHGVPVEAIVEYTDLDVSTVMELQAEMQV